MPKSRHHLVRNSTLLILLLSVQQARAQDTATTSGTPAKDASDDAIVKMEKFVSVEGDDLNGMLPPPNNVFGIAKTALETPRSVSMVTGEMIEKFNISDLSDLERFSPSSYTAFSFGVQGALSIRGDTADMYYGDMKRLNNTSNVPTIIGASDGVEIVRGPPSAVYGEGVVGGYMNYIPKSARASTGKYLDRYTGKITVTLDDWGGKILTAEVGGPLTIFGKKAGFYIYDQSQDSKTYYIGQKVEDETLQGTFTIDIADGLRFEVGGNFQHHRGTGIAGWNRVTQDLVDNRVYQTGQENFSLIDTNGDGIASRAELYNAGLTNNYNFGVNGLPVPNQVKPGTTAYTKPGGPLAFVTNVGTTLLSPRNVLLERINFGKDFIWFANLTFDRIPNLVITNKDFYEYQNYYKLSDIAYMRSGDTTLFEERLTAALTIPHLPSWLEIHDVIAGNIRYLDAYNTTTNVFQIFNYWDLTQYTQGQYLFANGWTEPGLAGVDSAAESKDLEMGIGNLLDLTAWKKLSLTVGTRMDWVDGSVENFQGLKTTGNVLAIVPPLFAKGSARAASLTSASLSYKIIPQIAPYITFATPRTVTPGTTGGVTTAQVTGKYLDSSRLEEGGVKGEFFKGRLFVTYAVYEQYRTAFNQTLNGGLGDFQQTRSDGQELEIRWVPTKRFNIALAGDWTSRFTDPLAPGQYTPVPVQTVGLDPIQFGGGRYQQGYPATDQYARRTAPAQILSAFGDYILGNSGFDVSAGASFIGGYAASNINDIYLPSALLFSADIGYRTKKWEVRLSGKNLTNQLYFTSTSGSAALIPQPGRTLTARFTYRF